MTVKMKGLLFLLYFTQKAAPFLLGTNIKIPCSLTGTLPAWVKDGNPSPIANEGSATINTGTFPSISYDTDQSTLLLSNLANGDAGTYTCSFSAGGSADFEVTVDVLTVTTETCPDAGMDGSCAVKTSCVTSGDASIEWICTETSNNKSTVVKSESTTNATSCDGGKTQLGALHAHKECDESSKYAVRYHYNVKHVAVDGVYLTNTCQGPYHLCVSECCGDETKAFYALTITAIVTEVVTVILIAIVLSKASSEKIIICLLVVAVIMLVVTVVLMAVAIDKGGRDTCGVSCSCDLMIVCLSIATVFFVISVVISVWLIIFHKADIVRCCSQSGGKPTATPAPPDRARGNAGGRQENGRKKETKFKPKDSPENDDTERKRPLPGPPKDEPQMQGKNVLPRIETKKSEREDSVVSRKDVEVHHNDYLRVDDHHHNRTNRGLSATIEPDQLPLNRLTPLDSSKTEKKVKKKKSKGMDF